MPGRRRRLLMGGLVVAGLGACAGTSPPVQLYQLRSQAPVAVSPRPPSPWNWQLMLPVRVPDYLDREPILLPQGRSGLLALSGQRWAESLRDSVPRVLRQDLATLLGADRVWTAPLPAGVRIDRQLRVELLHLGADADRRGVTLEARWSLVDPSSAQPPRADVIRVTVDSEGPDVDQLVAAHRLALWRLAEALVREAR